MIDIMSLSKITYGLYLISSFDGDKVNAMAANSVMQVSNNPLLLAAVVNKDCLTAEYILKSKVFNVMPLAENTDLAFIGNFGFRSGRGFDKFAKTPYEKGALGAPIIKQNTTAVYEAALRDTVDAGTHYLFIGELKAAKVLSGGQCLTYDYYTNVIKGKTPAGAPHS